MVTSNAFTIFQFSFSSSLQHYPSTPRRFSFPIAISTTSRLSTTSLAPHCGQPPRLSLTRRLLLPSASGIWDAVTGGNNSTREAIIAIRRGMQLFRQGDVLGSVVEFDKAIELDPRQKAYLWQRGLSLYYLNRFEDGAEQFRLDVAKNPNDTEEAIWCFLCEAPLYGADEARRRFLEVGRDPRPVMREVYTLFKEGGDPEKFIISEEMMIFEGLRPRNQPRVLIAECMLVAAFSGKGNQDDEYFYASLYAGLYYESLDKADAAQHYLVAACQSPYAQRSDDYMGSLAKVHCLCRQWSTDSNTA